MLARREPRGVTKMRRTKSKRLLVGAIAPLVVATLPLLLIGCGEDSVLQPDLTPAAKIDSPSSGIAIVVGESVDFQGSVIGGKPPCTYSWDFGGGAASSSEEDPTHIIFRDVGVYAITFTVEDSSDNVDSDYIVVRVLKAEQRQFSDY